MKFAQKYLCQFSLYKCSYREKTTFQESQASASLLLLLRLSLLCVKLPSTVNIAHEISLIRQSCGIFATTAAEKITRLCPEVVANLVDHGGRALSMSIEAFRKSQVERVRG
eukprot:4471894-Amphidinium_carterae.1